MSGKQKLKSFSSEIPDKIIIITIKKIIDYGKFNECKRLCWNLW